MTLTPGNAVVRTGSQFFLLDRETAAYIVEGPTAEEWVSFFKTTDTPDEQSMVTVQYAAPMGPTGWLPAPVQVWWSACRHHEAKSILHPCSLGLWDLPRMFESASGMFVRKVLLHEPDIREALVLGESKSVSLPLPGGYKGQHA